MIQFDTKEKISNFSENDREKAIYDSFQAYNDFQDGKLPETIQDDASLPVGALQQIMPTIPEKYAKFWFVNYIPVDPLTAPGVDELVYPRVDYYGEMTFNESEGDDNNGRVDIGITNVPYKVKRVYGHFKVSDYEADKLALASRNGAFLTQISLMREKQYAADLSYMSKREQALCEGFPELGIYGILNHPDTVKFALDQPFDASNSSANNLAILSAMEEAIDVGTNGVFSPNSMVMPNKSHTSLKNQVRSDQSDVSTLRWYVQNFGEAVFDGSESRSLEVSKTPRLASVYANGNSAAIMMCRSLECLRQLEPKRLTFNSIIQTRNGYEVSFHADIAGIQIIHPRSVVVMEFPAS